MVILFYFACGRTWGELFEGTAFSIVDICCGYFDALVLSFFFCDGNHAHYNALGGGVRNSRFHPV